MAELKESSLAPPVPQNPPHPPIEARRFWRAAGPALARSASLLSGSGAVICYHGVTTERQASEGIINIPAGEFEYTLGLLRTIGEIVPLRELVDHHARGKRSNGLFAVSFDDAYASLLDTVIPTVDRCQTPITIFWCTGREGRGLVFWWDRIEDLFPRVTPERWRQFEEAAGVPPAAADPAGDPLGALRRWIIGEHAGRLPPAADAALTELEDEVGWRTPQRSMSLAELEHVAARPWIDVGVHTVTHPVLPALPEHEARWEIEQCFRTLREHCPRTLRYLAIPYGLFDEHTARVAAAAGMKTCFSVDGVTLGRDYQHGILPRLVVTAGQTGLKFLLRVTGLRERLRR